jgi:hypothetical protein
MRRKDENRITISEMRFMHSNKWIYMMASQVQSGYAARTSNLSPVYSVLPEQLK